MIILSHLGEKHDSQEAEGEQFLGGYGGNGQQVGSNR